MHKGILGTFIYSFKKDYMKYWEARLILRCRGYGNCVNILISPV